MIRFLLPALLLLSAPAGAALEAAPSALAADEVEDLVAEGRRLLELGKPVEAEGLFRQAEELDGGSFRTRMWVLRARMDQPGHGNDTLDEIESLARAGNSGPEMDYLFGMAFARRAQEHMAAGLTGISVRMNNQDAVRYLSRAVEAEPERFDDAFLPLAVAAWFEGELGTAREAAEEAARRHPRDPEARLALGRAALSQFVLAKDDPERTAEADGAWEAARDAFAAAVERAEGPRDPRAEAIRADAAVQLAHVHLWREEADAARDAYAVALATDPTKVDLAQVRGSLGEEFRPLLEEAADAFERAHRAGDARDASLLWWLGYERWADREHAAAEEAFLAALEKQPGYANAWHYVALARYEAKDWEGVAEAIRAGWEIDPPTMVREMEANAGTNAARLEYVIGQAVQRGDLAGAAVVAELLANVVPDEPRHWNNLGLFLRDEGERLQRAGGDEAKARRLHERSLEAYERALDLRPDDPALMNDTAVILHYYLDRDLDRARSLYEDAARRAEELLAEDELRGEELQLVRIAARDAANNLRALEELLAEREEAARGPEEADGESGGP